MGQAFGSFAQDVVALAESEADEWLPGLLVVAKARQRDSGNPLEFRQTHAVVGAVVETERGYIRDDEVSAGGVVDFEAGVAEAIGKNVFAHREAIDHAA